MAKIRIHLSNSKATIAILLTSTYLQINYKDKNQNKTDTTIFHRMNGTTGSIWSASIECKYAEKYFNLTHTRTSKCNLNAL